MLIEIDRFQWDKNLERIHTGVAFNVSYLESIAHSFDCKVNYYVYISKDILQFAIALFSKGKKVIVPESFTYNPLWMDNKLSERKKIDILTELTKKLKSEFNKVTIKLNIENTDIRAFKWQGFSAELRYTYIRHKGAKIHKSIYSRLRRVKESKIDILIDKTNENDIKLNTNFLASLDFSKPKRKKYEKLLLLWNENNFLKSFRIVEDHNVLGCFIVLLDPVQKKAYTLAINGASRDFEYAHALVYKKITEWLDENNYEEVDFCGANFKGIAQFKSFFNPVLVPYFVVSYSYWQNKFSFFKYLFSKI